MLNILSLLKFNSISDYFENRKNRFTAYCIISSFFFCLAIGLVSLKDKFDFVVSDGRGYYVYLPSFIIDGDLDFENQIIASWGTDLKPSVLEKRTKTGLIDNKYPIGMSLTLAPSFLISHFLSSILYFLTDSKMFLPNGYSILYQLLNLLTILSLGTIAFYLIDLLLTRHLKLHPLSVFGAIIICWFCSHFSYYYFREPFMIHIISTFWVTLGIYLSKIFEQKSSKSLFIFLSTACSMAVVCRPTNIIVLMPFLVPIFFCTGRYNLIKMIPFGMMGLFPLFAQMVVWKVMHGSMLHYSYGNEGFNWLSPKLFSTIFSSKHGLLFWSPILGFSLYQLALNTITKTAQLRKTSLTCLVSFISLWYLNSCWHQWWFGDAFGGRAFLELTFIFVLGMSSFIQWYMEKKFKRRYFLTAVFASFSLNYFLMALYIGHKIPRADYLF